MNKLNPLENIDDWDDDILKRYPEKQLIKLKKNFVIIRIQIEPKQ